MVDPVWSSLVSRVGALTPSAPGRPVDGATAEGSFADELRQQLEQVNQMQTEADAGVQNLLTGRTQNITEVLAAARKAEVAFSLLMESRNKLADAYTELKRMAV